MSLPQPDQRHCLADEGWLELGQLEECLEERKQIGPLQGKMKLAGGFQSLTYA